MSDDVFIIDMSDKEVQLAGLSNTLKLLPSEWLDLWYRYFINEQKYEEAAICRDEIKSRTNANT